MEAIEGTILAGSSFEPVRGRVVIENGRIAAVEEAETASTDVVVPSFVNAHTHLGDSVAKEAAVGLGLEEAVAPPGSVKHRRLAEASRDELVAAMRRTLRFMNRTGTVSCLDFRESGVAGARALRAAAGPVDTDPFVLGSGDASVLEVADGQPSLADVSPVEMSVVYEPRLPRVETVAAVINEDGADADAEEGDG